MDIEQHQILKAIREEYICSISQAPIKDPVVTADGHTYERNFITQWLTQETKAPKTGLPLASTELIPNIAFKSLMEKLNVALPRLLSSQTHLKQQIANLKEQIKELKEELSFERERYEQVFEISQRQNKVKKIEKKIYQSKRSDIKALREQKQKYQRTCQQLKSKQYELRKQIQNEKQKLESKNTHQIQPLKRQVQKLKDIETKFKSQLETKRMIQGHLQTAFLIYTQAIGMIQCALNNVKATGQKQSNNSSLTQSFQKQLKDSFYLYYSEKQKIISRNIFARHRIMHQQIDGDLAENPFEQQNNPLPNFPVENNPEEQMQIQEKKQINLANYDVLMSIRYLLHEHNIQDAKRGIFYQITRKNYCKSGTIFAGIKLVLSQFPRPFNQFISRPWNFIKFLFLDRCNIDDEALEQFFDKSQNFSKIMVCLSLCENKLTKFDVGKIQKYPKLERLALARNNFSSQKKVQIYEHFENSPIKLILDGGFGQQQFQF